MTGPNLWGVFGREAGSHPDFRYSEALQAADIGDNIDQVVENTERPAETRPPAEARPDPEVLEQQKQEFEQVVQEATREAEDRLGDIMESTLASE